MTLEPDTRLSAQECFGSWVVGVTVMVNVSTQLILIDIHFTKDQGDMAHYFKETLLWSFPQRIGNSHNLSPRLSRTGFLLLLDQF